MERTSLITLIAVSDAKNWHSLTLENGYPDSASLEAYFVTPSLAPESAELTETLEDTDQGKLVRYTVSLRTFREDTLYNTFRQRHLILYIETLNGERYLLGTTDHPMELGYTRPTGMTISDSNEASIQITGTFPLSLRP